MRRTHRTIAVALIAAMAVLAAVRRYGPDLASPFRFEDDARQHVWWTYRFADPSLFPNDLAADYFSRFTFAPPGYQALARAFVPFVDAQAFEEIVPFALTAIVAVLAWLLGGCVSGGSLIGSAGAAAFALMGGVLARVEGGLPRAWAMPVLLFGLWGILTRRWAAFGASLLAAALFYPPLVVSLGLVGAIELGLEIAKSRKLPRRWPWLAALGTAALLTIILCYAAKGAGDAAPSGPKPTAAQARGMPEFGPEGRSKFFSPDPVEYYVANDRSGLGMPLWKVLGIAAALGIGAWIFPRAVPRPVWLIGATSLAGFAAAHATLFSLHLPSRYTRFTTPAFLMLWFATILPAAVRLARRVPPVDAALASVERPRTLAVAAAIVTAAMLASTAVRVRAELAQGPAPGWPEVMGYLATLPKDVLIAAHPTDASDIPLLARRSVLACEETSTPYDLGYYGEMKERLLAELMACYASDWTPIDRLFDRYGVAVFVASARRYRRPVDPLATYFEPFRSEIRGAVEVGARNGFALEAPPEERVLFRAGEFVVVKLRSNG